LCCNQENFRMPPKAAAGAGGGVQVSNLERISQMTLSGMSSADSFAFFVSKVPALKAFEAAWNDKELSGRDISLVDPFAFTSEMEKEFPSMSISIRNRMFEAVKAKIMVDFGKNTDTEHVVPIPLGQAWTAAVLGAVAPAVLARFVQNQSQVQQPNAQPFTAAVATPAAASKSFVFGAPKPTPMTLFPRFENVSGNAQMVAVAAQHPSTIAPMAAFAAQHFSPAPMAAFAAQQPPPAVGVLGAPMVALAAQQPQGQAQGAIPPPPVGDQPAQMAAFAAQQQLNLSSDFVSVLSPKLPWVKAAEIRAPAVIDPRFPIGFVEINIHKQIEEAVAERLKKPIVSFQTAAPVVWPKLEVFDRENYVKTRALYYEAVLASMDSGMFRDFKASLGLAARRSAFSEFQLDESSLKALADSEFMSYCDIFFGPKNARQAIAALEAITFETHKDKYHKQSDFVRKFDIACHSFELAVGDMVKCHSFWPTDTNDPEYGTIPLKTVMDRWANIFPKPKQGRAVSSSVQMDECRRFIDLNKDVPFDVQTKRLRRIFTAQDQLVLDKRSSYTTYPIEPPPKAHEPQAPRVNSRDTDVRPQQPRVSQNSRGDRQQSRGAKSATRGNRGRGGASSNGRQRGVSKQVPGHKRCPGCGAPNNHWGLGFTKDSCPLYGHRLAKKATYAWRNTEDEESVRIDPGEYKAILLANPKIRQSWDKARLQQQSRVSALSAEDHGEDTDTQGQSDDGALEDGSDANDHDSDKSENYLSSACPAINFEVPKVSEELCVQVDASKALSLKDFGHEEQFFGVTRFAKNDAFVAKTLLDPGAEINIISPTIANRCATQRMNVCVQIYQGKRKQTTVDEVVLCPFELQSLHGTWQSFNEWFAVSDMGYTVLLGRRFNRENGFTTFDERLMSFNAHDEAANSASIAALNVQPAYSKMFIHIQRTTDADLKSRYRRKPKRVNVIFSDDAEPAIARSELNVGKQYAALNILNKQTLNSSDYVELAFNFEKRNVNAPEQRVWFKVVDNADFNVRLPCKFMAALGTATIPTVQPMPADKLLNHSFVSDKRGPRHADDSTTSDSTPRASREHAPILFRGATEEAAIKLRAEQLKPYRFVSLHPVSKYELRRSPNPPLSVHYRKDHQNYEVNRDFKGVREAVNAAYDAAVIANACKTKERKLKSMLAAISTTSSAKSINYQRTAKCSSLSDYMDAVSADNALAAHAANVADEDHDLQMMAIEAMSHHPCLQALDEQATASSLKRVMALIKAGSPTPLPASVDAISASSMHHDFADGDYVEICGAVNRPEFNGQRARLYSKEATSGTWIIRVLGKNHGLWRCNDTLFKRLAPSEQRKSVPSSANAGFDDVGVDLKGDPDIELKNIVHRQFGSAYSANLTRRIEELRARFPHVFTTDVTEPCDFEPMKIHLIPNAVLPSKARFYRNTPKMREEVRRQIQEQLEWGAIRKCVTPYVSDVLLVKRPHMPGKFRFVVSYIKLNEATVKEQLIMPDPKSQHERLAGNCIFGALDFSSYYRQIRLHEDSQLLTGFASDEGTYCYTRVPMGITGACMYAQKVLQEALAADPVLGPLGIKNYFDDLPFGAKTEDEFMFILEALLQFCAKWKLKVNPDKSILGVTSITHVGFVVSEKGVSIDPERNRDIRELTAPKSIKKVQSILGIFNYVRNFIPNFSDRARFLTDKLASVPVSSTAKKRPASTLEKSNVVSGLAPIAAISAKLDYSSKKVEKAVPKFVWSDDDQKKFEELKQLVMDAPMLAQLDYGKAIYIRCDASRFGAGAVLFQYDERGFENVVCYASRKFLPAERNWSTFSQEASTVVWALERFAEYTQGYHTIVECDHRNISFVKKSAMPQLARWRLRLQDMDFSVRFLAGSANSTADGLSRQHVDDVEVELQQVIPECALLDAGPKQTEMFAVLSALELAGLNTDYADIAPVSLRSHSAAAARAEPQAEREQLAEPDMAQLSESDSSSDADELSDDELPLRFGPDGEILNELGMPIEVPEHQPAHLAVPVLDAEVEFNNVHNDLLGHAGTFVTLQRVLKNERAWATRKQMIVDVDNFIKACPSCQKMRKRSSRSFENRHTISGSPFAELSIDMLKLPKPDALGMQYVVVIVDSFSHWTSLVAVRNKSAFDAARALMHVIGNFGAPLRIRSDGGKEFVGGVLVGLTRLMGAANHVVLPYTPTANGIVERANRAVLERLREMIFSKRLVQHTQHQWSDLLPMVQRAINASVHSATGTSPARIMFGDNLDLDRCLLTRAPNSRELDMNTYVDALTWNQRIIIEEADLHQSKLCERVMAKARASQRVKVGDRFVDKPVKALQVGDWVLVQPQPNYPLHKLAPRWLGPFQIEVCSDASDVVTVFDTLKTKRRQFLRRDLELFDVSRLADVEGLKRVAESDEFEFPVESIIGVALINEGGLGSNPVQLSRSFKRGSRKKSAFQFLVKWAGYEEPTWVEYKVASRLVQFPGYVVFFEGLRMD